jgi:DNA-binding XRE family transcriptional regulator
MDGKENTAAGGDREPWYVEITRFYPGTGNSKKIREAMNVNKNLLKGKIRENGMNQADAAKKIGMSLSRFNAKINETANAEFKLREIKALRDALKLSCEQVEEIFLK